MATSGRASPNSSYVASNDLICWPVARLPNESVAKLVSRSRSLSRNSLALIMPILALNPQHVLMGDWGAAWWETGLSRTSPPTAAAAGLCPEPCINNIAESFGFPECLRRALRNPGRVWSS